MIMWVHAAAWVLAAASPAPSELDLIRASTKVPRGDYKGAGQTALSSVLNGHLLRSERHVVACEDWTPQELQTFMGQIEGHRSPELQAIYESAHDRRRMTVAGGYVSHWRRLNELVEANPHLAAPLRDAHCREAVMWWTHHLADEKRVELRAHNLAVPLLPLGEKKPCGSGSGSAGEEEVCLHVEQANSCDWCHSTQAAHDAGVPGTSAPNALKFTNGPDDGNPHGWDRLRRCDQDQIPRCKPCEGVGGHAWGDKNEDINLVECSVVSLPNATNMSTVHKPLYPKKFTISSVDGRPGYSDTLIGWKTDPFCFGFFPQNDSIPPLCYRSQDSTGKWYDAYGSRNGTAGAARTDYNIKLTGLFHPFPNITASILQTDWEMWIQNHLWVVDQCICANPSGNHCTNKPAGQCRSYVWHWDTFKDAEFLARERIGVEWIQNAGVGKNAKMWELDHFISWSHHAWTDPVSGRIVRMWKPFNGLQNYDPEAWTDDVDSSKFESPPAKCKKGGAKVRINCDDDGHFHPKAKAEGLEYLEALHALALKVEGPVTAELLRRQIAEAMEAIAQ